MIGSGIAVAVGSGIATVGLCATGAGCLASPVTVSSGLGGIALAYEGGHYTIHQRV